MQPRAIISGVHSDPDPSPGIGIARSLKDAFPDVLTVAVDYSIRSSGIHHDCFDEVWLQPVWGELDLESYERQISESLREPNSCWLSGLDVEAEWLASMHPDVPRLLVPSLRARRLVQKPEIQAARSLGMEVPRWIRAQDIAWNLHAFGRAAGWNLWVKGQYHEAYPARSFPELYQQIERMLSHWPAEDVFIQEHVGGFERAYVFAAYQGRLLGAVEVEKRNVTIQGKTWGAEVAPLAPEARRALEAFVGSAHWTGGGEVEFIRSYVGADYLIDLNPRFPAYIYGVTLCGHNLPAQLLAAALDVLCPAGVARGRQFCRVVHEIPVRSDFPLSPLTAKSSPTAPWGKHPSHQPELVRRLRGPAAPARSSPSVYEKPIGWEEAVRAAPLVTLTPQRLALVATAEQLFTAVTTRATAFLRPRLTPALSIKTQPEPLWGQIALRQQWWAEAISAREVKWALHLGFSAANIIYNGPRLADLLSAQVPRVGAVFADSLPALAVARAARPAHVIGLRLRVPSVPSRFGIDLSEPTVFSDLIDQLRSDGGTWEYGVHFHCPSDTIGPPRWWEVMDEVLHWSEVIKALVGRGPQLFDVGGGWHAQDFFGQLLPALDELHARVRRALPGVEQIVLEPGKAVCSPTSVLVTEVTEVRQRGHGPAVDVVVDASVADLPMAALYPHRVLLISGNEDLAWGSPGSDRLLGCICMENDILVSEVTFPHPPAPGDLILIFDAGGYDASMAWNFAQGVTRDALR
jgi:diaminopimelate decarboxylase